MKSHFEKVADYVMADDHSDLGFVKAERDFALHCLEREIAIGEQDRARIEALGSHVSHLEAHRDSLIDRVEVLEAALREIAEDCYNDGGKAATEMTQVARTALAPEQDK